MRRRQFIGIAAAGMLVDWSCALRPDAGSAARRSASRVDGGWRFTRGDVANAAVAGFDVSGWEAAILPHTARIEALVTGPQGSPTWQWQGVCWYRRPLRIEAGEAERVIELHFEAAMNVADVYLDGERVGGHMGGWLPFSIDLTGRLEPGRDHVLAVRLDNTDNATTGPKPLVQLDFNPYHGLYRHVHLTTKDPLHITDALLADVPAGGGVFVTYPGVSADAATVRVTTHVRNARGVASTFRVRTTLLNADGSTAAQAESPEVTLGAATDRHVTQDIDVRRPRLWSPASPALYVLRTEVVDGRSVADATETRIGIRRIGVTGDGFTINGERLFLRGTNRHQEYPYIGYAMSDAAQYRDALKIKQAGFDYIRLSHYTHAPAFMDACDELGLVVMDCIPGWQFFNRDPAFIDLQYRNCRDMIRRDRNHPCVAMWEVSLNESGMTPEFIQRTKAIAHEEYPGDQCFTAGWMHGYDVFIDARQHGGCRGESAEPCIVSEYGDWEYYAMNAGLDQDAWSALSPAESNSRQLRWQGERALLQQAANFQEAHDDNHAAPAFGDGLWVMYDYNRGYAPDIESSGCMDIFRLPKFSYWFFRSQRDASELVAGDAVGPVLFIASRWTADSATDVRVFTNCDEVSLTLNGREIARRAPERGRASANLKHPPITFDVGAFEAGTLEAVGFIGGGEVARHAVRTPGAIDTLALVLDTAGRARDGTHQDHLFCYAELRDANGTVVDDAWENVAFGTTGAAAVVGHNPFATDAGIATILVRTDAGDAPFAVYALAFTPTAEGTRIVSGTATPGTGSPAAHRIRYTTDGSEPGAASPEYTSPLPEADALRAALFVGDDIVASLAASEPKYRIPVSAPPDSRGPFRR